MSTLLIRLLSSTIALSFLFFNGCTTTPSSPEDLSPIDTAFSPIGNLIMSEICPSNAGWVTDEDLEDPDWIELYNRGDTTINLSGYALSDDINNPVKWRFQEGSIPPKTHLLVFASGKDRTIITEKTPDDSIKNFRTQSWSDTFNTTPTRGKSTVHPYEFSKIDSLTESGYRLLSATLNLVDNHPDLLWSSAFVKIEFRKRQINEKNNYSAYKYLEVLMTVPKDSMLNLRFVQRSLPDWKGPYFPIRGTGIPNDLYRFPLEQGKNGLDLTDLTGFKLEVPERKFGKVSFSVSRITFTSIHNSFHTNFKISGDDGSLTLTDNNGTLVDKVTLQQLPVNQTLGRINGQWQISARPTPGTDNTEAGYAVVTSAPVNVTSSGFYDTPVTIDFVGTANQSIYFTLDGSLPSAKALPFPNDPYLDKLTFEQTTVLRYRAYEPGALESPVITQTFFINTPQHLPVMALTTDPSLLFDSNSGLYMKGPLAEDSFPYFGANFWSDREIPVHCELFEKKGRRGFACNAGLAIAGNWSRGSDKKSLEINFREIYGENNLEYSLFPDYPDLCRFKKFILRNTGTSYSEAMIDGPMMSSLIDNIDLDYQKSRPVAVYINGKYFGIHFLMEPSNQDYLYTNYNLDKVEIDFIDAGGMMKWGTTADWNQLTDLLYRTVGSDCSKPLPDSIYTVIGKGMDLYNFIDYQAFEVFINNTDWPSNNSRSWKVHGDTGKWRWLVYDLDAGFGGFGYVDGAEKANFNTLDFALDPSKPDEDYPNGNAYTFPLRALLKNSTFRENFVNRFCTLLATNFTTDHIISKIDSLTEAVAPEAPADLARWGMDIDKWKNSVNNLKIYAHDRPRYVMSFLKDRFSSGTAFTLSIASPPGSVQINGLTLREGKFTGVYFSDVPVTLTASPVSSGRFVSWSDGNTENPRRLTLAENTTLSAEFSSSSGERD